MQNDQAPGTAGTSAPMAGVEKKPSKVAPASESGQCPPEIQQELLKNQARIRQLRQEIASRQEENDKIIAENLRQNEELQALNSNLDNKVKERTRELQESKEMLEQQNQELKELSESKEAMMHMIVHDLKNPLTSIMGALTLSQNPRYELNPDLKMLLRDANIQSIKLRAMIDDILTMSRMRSKEFSIEAVATDLVSLIQQSVMFMTTTLTHKKVNLRYTPSLAELVVNIDFQMVERVINNVLNNAIKYAPINTDIVVDITRDQDWACVHVRNWGEAIPQETHKKIFEMFGRAKPQDKSVQGTGLGLAFCKLAVEAHKGTIAVESPIPPDAKGAHFYFTLPIFKEPA